MTFKKMIIQLATYACIRLAIKLHMDASGGVCENVLPESYDTVHILSPHERRKPLFGGSGRKKRLVLMSMYFKSKD